MLLSSCSDKLNNNDSNETIVNNVESSEIAIQNGHLVFSTQTAFDDYIEIIEAAISENSTGNMLKSSKIIPKVQGFYSLADKLNKISENKLKSSSVEPSEEEMVAEFQRNLIESEALMYVLDTANQIGVAENIYEITPLGTFSYHIDNKEEYETMIININENYLNYTEQIDSITYKYGNITLTDTYGYIQNRNFSMNAVLVDLGMLEIPDEEVQEDAVETKSTSTDTKINSDFTSTYNLNTVDNKWFRDEVRKIDSKHKMYVKFYNRNYAFYARAGFKCVVKEKRVYTKRVCVSKRWGWCFNFKIGAWFKEDAEQMAIGIDYLKAHIKYEDFGLTKKYNTNFNAAYANSYNSQKKWSNTATKYGIQSLYNLTETFLSGDVKDYFTDYFSERIDFHIKFNSLFDIDIASDDLISEVYDESIDAGIDLLTKKTSSLLYKHGVKPTQPRYLEMISPFETNTVHIALAGIEFENNTDKMEKKFPSSCGFPKIVNRFRIDEAYIFGAVKYNNKWFGTRVKYN